MLGNLFSAFTGGGAGAQGAGIEQDFNQLGIDEIRNQFDNTSQLIQPFINAGTQALPTAMASATTRGLDRNLGGIFDSKIFSRLFDSRRDAVEGQLSAGGLTRSGEAVDDIAGIPAELGLMIEQMLSGRNQQLVGQGQNAAMNLGNMGGNMANAIAQLFQRSGEAGSSGAVTDAQAKAGGLGSLVSTGLSVAGFFSDPRLKCNAEPVGKIGPLTLYEWDWIPEAEGTIVADFPTLGFFTTEVKKHFPEFVGEYGGFEVMNYPGLLDHLEAMH